MRFAFPFGLPSSVEMCSGKGEEDVSLEIMEQGRSKLERELRELQKEIDIKPMLVFSRTWREADVSFLQREALRLEMIYMKARCHDFKAEHHQFQSYFCNKT